MKLITSVLLGLTLVSAMPAFAKDPKPQPVNVPAGVDHGTYDRVLKKYVNSEGLVAYAKWKNSSSDREALDNYSSNSPAAIARRTAMKRRPRS